MIRFAAPFGALGAIALLTSAAAPRERNLHFMVELKGLELIPGQSLAGTVRELGPSEDLLLAKVGFEHGALPRSRTRITVSGIDYTLSPSMPLVAARKVWGGDLVGEGRQHTFCAKGEQNRRERMGRERYLGGIERYAKETRLCLVDSDGDQSFDKAFVIGTELDRDWYLTDIAPLPYAEHRHIDLGDDWRVRVTYSCSSKKPKCTIYTYLLLNGRTVDMASLKLSGERPSRTASVINFRADKLPYRFTMGSAAFTVTAAAQQPTKLTVRYDSDFTYAPLTYSLVNHTQYIFIYI